MPKKLLLTLLSISLLAAAAGVAYLYRSRLPALPLISPLFTTSTSPDLTPKLTQRLPTTPPLDYSTSRQLPDLPDTLHYLLYQPLTGKVYAHRGSTDRLPPASFTKLLTTQVALDLASPTQLFTATSETINKEPTILGLRVGEQLSTLELIRAAISTSANDAAATLAQGVASLYGRDPSFFITLMNQKASLMNMKSTHFANPEGYDDDNQYSTLEDLYLMITNAQQNYPDILAAGSSDRDDLLATSTHGFYYLPNWNTLLGLYPGVNGLKIAYTEKAGYSVIVTAVRDEHPTTLILTGATTIPLRDLYASQLLDYAYSQEKFSPQKLTKTDFKKRYDDWKALREQILSELATLSAEPKD